MLSLGFDSYYSCGFGLDLSGAGYFSDKYVSTFGVVYYSSFSMQYLGFGVGTGVGSYKLPKLTEKIDGVNVVIRDESQGFYLLVCPYIDIIIEPISLFVGYNFHIFNGAELNGFRFGVGLYLDD